MGIGYVGLCVWADSKTVDCGYGGCVGHSCTDLVMACRQDWSFVCLQDYMCWYLLLVSVYTMLVLRVVPLDVTLVDTGMVLMVLSALSCLCFLVWVSCSWLYLLWCLGRSYYCGWSWCSHDGSWLLLLFCYCSFCMCVYVHMIRCLLQGSLVSIAPVWTMGVLIWLFLCGDCFTGYSLVLWSCFVLWVAMDGVFLLCGCMVSPVLGGFHSFFLVYH